MKEKTGLKRRQRRRKYMINRGNERGENAERREECGKEGDEADMKIGNEKVGV